MFARQNDMDVTSPSPKRQLSTEANKSKKLPSFLLGHDPVLNRQTNQNQNNLFNNTPLKGRKMDQDHGQRYQNSNLFNRMNRNKENEHDDKGLIKTLPFSSNNVNVDKPKTAKCNIPTLSLGGYNRNIPDLKENTGDKGKKLNTTQNTSFANDVLTPRDENIPFNPKTDNRFLYASSPLPEKTNIPKIITTPGFNIDNNRVEISPVLPVGKTVERNWPLSKQIFERKRQSNLYGNQLSSYHDFVKNEPHEINCSNNEANQSNYNQEDEMNCWVSLFGFNSNNLDIILKQFFTCGSIVSRRPSRKEGANWIHLRFASTSQAKRAISLFNHRIIQGTNTVVGVVECLEPNAILEFVKGTNLSTSVADINNPTFGMRNLIRENNENSTDDSSNLKSTKNDSNPFDVPIKENDGVVKRALGFMLPSFF